MILKHLIRKEFIQMGRNPFLLRLILLYPVVIVCVMPWVMSMEVRNIGVTVVDNDRSTTSRRLIHRIEASNYFVFKGQADTYADGLKRMERGQTDIVLEVPPRYERGLVDGRQPQIHVAANTGNATKGGIGAAYLSQIVTANLRATPSEPRPATT